MSEVSITPASVVPAANAEFFQGTAGGTITAGMACYLDTATNTLKAADANLSAAAATVKGIAAHGASAGQPLRVQTTGSITIGGTVVLATIYVLSPTTAGSIVPDADAASGSYCSIIGVATSASVLALSIFNSGALKA